MKRHADKNHTFQKQNEDTLNYNVGRAIKCHLWPEAELLKRRWTCVLSLTDTGNLRQCAVCLQCDINQNRDVMSNVRHLTVWLQGLPRFIAIRVGFYGTRVTKVNNNTTGWPLSSNVTPLSQHPSLCGVVLSRSLVAAGPGQACGRGEGLLCVRMRLEEGSSTGAFTHPVTQQFQSCVLVNNPLPPFLLSFPLIPSALVEPPRPPHSFLPSSPLIICLIT